ncbi:protein phosphatase 2C 51-like [Andrographis paniculata]|uniref:protein phosphatase 2C 51-like n=1 Tax=Andrographis paniculata TaxID=175694 RepID=UPI0021E8BA73|nr:protein phosphatase 2C 51-like [Andrographis paniculata]
MIFGSLRQRSPAPEESCRRLKSLSDSKVEDGDLGDNEARRTRSFRRKRMELRRFSRSLSASKSEEDLLFRDESVNRKRSEGEEETTTEEKSSEIDGGCSGSEAATASHGMVSIIGRRREMEDVATAELGFLKIGGRSYDFFGVYDGHGGRRVAHECGVMLHKVLAGVVEEDETSGGGGGGEIDWEKTVTAGFKKMDEEVNKSGAAVATMGTTAVVAVVGETEVVIANCGDSRAVLSRGGAAVQLSDDHKPDRPDELERIEISGGKVINWNGERVLGVLATSRSIGDYYLKPYVIPEPEVRVLERTDKDEFVILASDGLWDVVSNDLACQVVRRCLFGQIRRRTSRRRTAAAAGVSIATSPAAEAAAVLAELAMGRGSRDNISVVVVGLESKCSVVLVNQETKVTDN